MPKPFIAARIPQVLADKLDERTKDSEHGKTGIIINALAQYLGCSIDIPEKTRAVDRLVAVEKELTELRNRITALEKPSNPAIQKELLLDNDTVNKSDKGLQIKKSSKQEIAQNNDNNTDKKAENTNKTDGPSNINLDNDQLTNKQISELTGFKFETVRTRHRKSIPIEWEGEQYNPVKEGNRQKWQISDNKSD